MKKWHKCVKVARDTVAMVTYMYCVSKMITTYSPMIGYFFDTMIVSSLDISSLDIVLTMTHRNPSVRKC